MSTTPKTKEEWLATTLANICTSCKGGSLCPGMSRITPKSPYTYRLCPSDMGVENCKDVTPSDWIAVANKAIEDAK